MFGLSLTRKFHPFQLLLGIGILLTTCFTSFTSVQAQVLPSNQPLPNNSNASGEQNFQQGNLTRAIQQWSRDIKNGHNIVTNLFNRSQAYILLKQYQFALEDVNQIIQIEGKNTPSQVFVVKGIALSELNQLQEAIQSFNTAEKLDSSPGLYNNRALAYQRLGQLNKALVDLTKSVQLLPTPIARLNLANLRIQLNQFQQVVNEMNQLIATDKTFFPAYLTRGIAYYNLGQYETAVRDFVVTLKIWPDQPEAYYYAGLSFAKLNRLEDASQNLIRSADLYLQRNQSNEYHQVLRKMNELNLQ